MSAESLLQSLSGLSWIQCALLVPSGVLLVNALSILYNIYFHPLASLPGSRLSAASNLPYQISRVFGKGAHYIADQHAAYGPVVRFAPNDISYTNAPAWKETHGHRAGHGGPLQRERVMCRDLEQFGAWNLMIADAPDHARQRKQLSPAFTDKALREQEGLIMKYIDFLTQRFRETAGTEIDIGSMFNFATFDIVGELAFGQNEFQSLEKMRTHPWVGMIFSFLPMLGLYGAVLKLTPWLQPLLDGLVPKKAKEEIDGHVNMTVEFVNRRLAEPSDKPDIISYIMRETKAGPSSMLENREIYATTAIMIIAGSETTATALTGSVYLLLRNPDKLAKLQREVRGHFASDADITHLKTAELKYLLAVLDEAQRVYPAVPQHGNRIAPAGGCTVGGHYIPEGSIIGVTPYAAFRSESNFRDAKQFVPERWLGDDRYADDNRDVFQPFGYGPYSCIGKRLAHLESRTMLAKLVWNFDMELVNKTDDWLNQTANIVWERPPLMVKLTERADIRV